MQVTPWNGKQIKKPGWYSGIPLAKYHSRGICNGVAVSSSNLRTCWRQSPAHMFAGWCENAKAEKDAPTRTMMLGSAAHHILLGEDHFKKHFAMQPLTYRDKVTAQSKPWHNGADACRAWNQVQQANGMTVVTQNDLVIINAMAKSLSLEPIAADLLTGLVEHSGFAKDKETGLWLKIRPDVIPTFTGDYVDLKTAADVTTVALQSTIRSFGYHQQGGLIWEVVEALGDPFQSFVLMFVENAVPHCARTVPLTDHDLSLGRRQNRDMLRKIAQCITDDRWPGPGDNDIRPLPLATDERDRIEYRLKMDGVA